MRLPSIARKLNKDTHLFIKTEGVSDESIMQISQIVTKAISAKREDRYTSPKELKKELERWLDKV